MQKHYHEPNHEFRKLVQKLNGLQFMLEYVKDSKRKNELQIEIDKVEKQMEDALC